MTSTSHRHSDPTFPHYRELFVHYGFNVGHHEIHHVFITYDKFNGALNVTVDGMLALNHRHQFAKVTTDWHVTVGHQERHLVQIQRERKLFMAALRPMIFRIFVDGQLIQQIQV